MNKEKTLGMSTSTLVLAAVLTALVVILQFIGATVRFGPFSISLVLIPIVIGTATCGVGIGAWLGFVFAMMVFITGDANAFFAVNIPGTIITVILKGVLAGLLSGLAYRWVSSINKYLAVVVSAIVCPVVNTGVFILGCLVFFLPTIGEWAIAEGFAGNAIGYLLFVMVGLNFLVELGINIVLSPVIVRILNVKSR